MAGSSAQAHLTLQDAFERFAVSVNPEDKRLFSNTKLQDVRDEAISIERQLRARRTQRNMARLEPFLRGMEHYSKVVEVLCNGTPYLSWVWAPVKLMLMITSDSISAFEKLIEAYGKIADMMPRFDRLANALVNDYNFQNVMALVYSDILEFHRRAYKFVRRKSWTIFFHSMWSGFESRFNAILKRLAYHSELVDKEAVAADIDIAMKRKEEDTQRWEQQESEWKNVKVQTVLSWLGTDDPLPGDALDRHNRDCLPGSCDWFSQDKRTQSWLKDGTANALLWLYGKPGAGKSAICSNLVQHAEANGINVFFYFCSYLGGSKSSSRLLRSLVSQIIQKHQDLAFYVYDIYFKSYSVPSQKALLGLLPELLQGLGSVRFIIDGIDEWVAQDQKLLLKDLLQMLSINSSTYICKILISSRDTLDISRSLRKKDKAATLISLSDGDQSLALSRSIGQYIDEKLSDLPDHFDELDPDSSILAEVKQTLLNKSNGMFLWVRLVLDSLETVYSPAQLRNIINDLPSDLEALYERIFVRLCSVRGLDSYGGVPRMISWVCFAQRPLHKHELLHGLAVSKYNIGSDAQNIPAAPILDHCKPFVDVRSDSTVAFVHFSIKEFFLKYEAPKVVPPISAQLDFTYACAVIITQSLELLHLGATSADNLVRIASGSYRLLPYALEFWIEHCLLYTSTGTQNEVGQDITYCLSYLYNTHDQLSKRLGMNEIQIIHPGETSSFLLDERLAPFNHMPVSTLMRGVLHARWLASQHNAEDGEDAEAFTVQNDQTLISKLTREFNSAVIHILSQNELSGISRAALKAFQISYASTAFHCRYPHCTRSSSGFASEQLRTQHEQGHLQRVYCKVSSCQYNRIGFAKKSALSSHTRRYHNETLELPIPAKIRRPPPHLNRVSSSGGEEPPTPTTSTPVAPITPHSKQSFNPQNGQPQQVPPQPIQPQRSTSKYSVVGRGTRWPVTGGTSLQ